MNGRHKRHETILVVDDDPNILDTFKDFLSVLGYDVVALSSGAKAINYLAKNTPSCAIIDMVMPEISGLELMDYIRDNFPYLSFIAVSGLAEIDVVKTAMQKGAYDYLVKPVKITDLAMTVKRAIERGKLLKENIEYRDLLEYKVNEQTKYIKKMFIRAINAMIKALEARDVYTKGHSERVSVFSVLLGKSIGLKRNKLNDLRISALLHDIGKIGVKDAILSKPADLSAEEKQIVQKHPVTGEKILKYFIDNKDILRGVRNHHERYDGNGYPDRLKGKEIPLFARIICITDTFDALKTDRPYRKGKSTNEIVEIIKKQSGKQFDPEIANLFINLINEKQIIP